MTFLLITKPLFFQLENVSNKLLDYGILGIMVIVIGFIAFKMYNKINDDQKEWREIAKTQLNHNYKTNIEQNSINQKLIDIRERDVQENRDFHRLMENKMDQFPTEVRTQLRSELLEHKLQLKNKK